MDQEWSVEVRRVANGFIVRPSPDDYARGVAVARDEINVFNDFASLFAHLRERLGEPGLQTDPK